MRHVFFDLMGTVLADPYREALGAATGLGLERLVRRRDPSAWPAFERGAIDEETFAERFFLDGTRLDLATFHRVRRAGYRYLPGMRALLDELADAATLHIASNYPAWIDELRLRFDFDARFTAVWASCHLGVRKPDRAFYEALLARSGVPPGDGLFVDDREVNCVAAEQAGLRAHLFTGAGDLRRRLRAEGVLGR
ncbi:MAG: HAD family hydrolase [Actinomycetota bacterium]